jgi:L-asparagine transporter-like permease
MQHKTDDRSLGDLFADLSRETTTLVRQEINLAKTEMTQKATRAGKEAGFLVAGGAVVYAGVLAILAAIILALGQAGVPWWLSALIVGAVVVGIGYVLIRRGLDNLKHEDMTPRQTMDTIKGDIDAIKGA